nr:MAG TPA: YopX protein [Caudoviricetes sp.]
MKNRFLFRGKTIGGSWVQGFLHANVRKDHWYISNKAASPYAYEVIPDTICQCTGYKGIYEHDIFNWCGERYEILWSNELLMWVMRQLDSDEIFELRQMRESEIIVTGNMFDELRDTAHVN